MPVGIPMCIQLWVYLFRVNKWPMHHGTSFCAFSFFYLTRVVWRFMSHVSRFHTFKTLQIFHLVPIYSQYISSSGIWWFYDIFFLFRFWATTKCFLEGGTLPFPQALLEGVHFLPSPVVTYFNDYFDSHPEEWEVSLPCAFNLQLPSD